MSDIGITNEIADEWVYKNYCDKLTYEEKYDLLKELYNRILKEERRRRLEYKEYRKRKWQKRRKKFVDLFLKRRK